MVLVLHIHGHCQVVGHQVNYHAREEEVHLTNSYEDTQKTADGAVHPPNTSYDEVGSPTEWYIGCPISCPNTQRSLFLKNCVVRTPT